MRAHRRLTLARALRLDTAVVVIALPPLAFGVYDVWLIVFKDTSWSRHAGALAREHPVAFWSVWTLGWLCGGLHLYLELRGDPFNWFSRWLQRIRQRKIL